MGSERQSSRAAVGRAPTLVLLLALLGAGLGAYGLVGFQALVSEVREERAAVAVRQEVSRHSRARMHALLDEAGAALDRALSPQPEVREGDDWAARLVLEAQRFAALADSPRLAASAETARLEAEALRALQPETEQWAASVRAGEEDRTGWLERRGRSLRARARERLALTRAAAEGFLASLDEKHDGAELAIERKLDQTWARALLFGLLAWAGFVVLALLVGRWLRAHMAELERARDAAWTSAADVSAAKEARGRFLAKVSHEVRTPLNGVLGMSAQLLQTDLTPEQIEITRTLQACTESLHALVDDLLDFSDLEAGRIKLRNEPFHLRVVLEDVVDLLGERAAEKKLELVCHVHADLPQLIEGDALRLRQLLIHLASNALKFSEHGEVLLRALPGGDDGNGQPLVRFEVSDNGVGISAGARERLFAPFAQADDSSARLHGGLGLGLTLSRQLVGAMGGLLHCDSVPGQGSTFHFTLPLRAKGQARLPGRELFAGLRALLVGLQGKLAQVLELELESWGLQVQRAEHLEQARAWQDAGEAWDVALVDARQCGDDPHAPGAALATLARGGQACARIVLITGPRERGLRARARELGMECLIKPLRPTELLETLRRCLPQGPAPALPKRNAPAVASAEAQPGLRVLLAEDNDVNQRVARRMLESLGWQVDVAPSGPEALRRHAEQAYDLVLMDCQMPGMDGFTVTREIRRREVDGRRTPIVALTANGTLADRAACTASGMDAFLEKPVVLEALAKLPRELGLQADQRSSAPAEA